MRTKSMFTALALVLLLSTFCHAGGPLVVGGPALGTRPAFGTDGVAFTWNPAAMPIQYRVDPGPMATTASGAVVISNATGLQRVRSMFNVWQSVPTATVSFNNAGPILPTGAYTGGDVSTIAQFDAITASCNAGTQNPVIFDSNGSLLAALGLSPNIIGFNSGCSVDPSTGFIKSSMVNFKTASRRPAAHDLTSNLRRTSSMRPSRTRWGTFSALIIRRSILICSRM